MDLHVPGWRAHASGPKCDGVAHAYQTDGPATNKTGFIYMLAGDTGASNTDPWAKSKTGDNHWIETGLARDDCRCRCEDHDGRLSAVLSIPILRSGT